MRTVWFENEASGQVYDVVKGSQAEKRARQDGCKEIAPPKAKQEPKGKGGEKTSTTEGAGA